MEIQEKINALMEQKEFAEALAKATNAQEVVDLFKGKDIDVPEEIAQELFEPMLPEEGELTEEALGDVAGGGSFGAAVGGAIGDGVFYGAGYLGARMAGWSKSKSKSYAKSCAKFGKALGGMIGGLSPF